jgi:hypothetical protein
MDIDAALKDGYSIQEINAEAARRAGFNLTAALADGYSDDEILQELRGRLVKPSQPTAKDKTMAEIKQAVGQQREGLTGTAESLLSLGTGAVAQVAGIPVAGIQKLRSSMAGVPTTFEKEYADAMQRMTLEPRTEAGQEMTGRIGKFINDVVVPVAPMLGGMPMLKAGDAALAAKARVMPRAAEVPKPVEVAKPKTGVAAMKDELAGKTEPTVPVDPNLEYYKQQALAKEQAALEAQRAAGERPITVGPEGVEMPGMRSAQEAMANFDRDVRRTERQRPTEGTDTMFVTPEGEALFNPLFEDQQRLNMVKGVAGEQQRLAAESAMAQRSQQGTQASVFEPQTNMYRPYQEFFVQENGQVRPLSKAEFMETLDNLAKEPGTAFVMPENIGEAYKQYLEHPAHGQMDFFGANEVPVVPAYKTLAEMTPAEKTKFTKAGKKLGITPEMEQRMREQELFPGITKLHANFDPESFKMAGLSAHFGKSPMLNVPGVGDRLKSLGNAMIETPEAAIDLAKNAPDVSQNMVQRGVNALTKGGIFLKAKVNNPVVHYTVDRFLKAEGLADAEVLQKLQTNYLGSLRELSKAERTEAFELLNLADLNQKTITPEMMQKYGLSERLQGFITEHQTLMADVLDKINTAREATGKKPITGRDAYSAMSMTGDFRKVVYKMVDGKQEVVGVIGADSKTLGKRSLSALEKKVLEKDPSLSFGPLQDLSQTTRSMKGTPHEAFQDVLATLGENNPHIAEFVKTLKEVAKDDPSNYLGMQKHTMQKKGVFGMEGRKFWETTEDNARAFFENQLRYAESAYKWSHLAEAAKDVNEVIRNPEVVAKQDQAIRLADDYMQNALGINPSRMGRALNDFTNSAFGAVGLGPSYPRAIVSASRAVANTWMLSLSPAFLGMQIVQAPAVIPSMTALLRGRGMAPKMTWLTQGMDYFAESGMTFTKAMAGMELSTVERGALKYAKDNHVYATDMVEHANQIEKGAGYYTTKLTQTPAAITEQATRAQVYMTFVHMLDDAGLSTKDGLYEQAHRFTDMAMVNYSAIEKPTFYNSLGPIGSAAYNLKSFAHNEISKWSMFAREIAETGNPAPLLTQMATTIALAGVMGLPFFSQFEELYDFITKKLGKPRSLALDVQEMSKAVGKELGPNATFALSNGAPTLLGVDLSTRLGLGDVIPSNAADAAFAGGGKLYEMGKATGRAIIKPSEENLKAAAINLAPPVAQGPLDVAWYQKNGLAYSKDPEKLRPMARRNDADILFKKIGLTGINESSQKLANYQNSQLDKAYAEYRSAAMRTIAQDLFRNRPIDPKTLEKYFVTGQGDPTTFSTDIQRLAVDMNLDPQSAITLKQAASQRIPQLRSLERRAQ